MLDRMVALTSKEGDTKEDRELKMQFVPLALMCFILSLAALVSVLVSPPHSITMTIGCYIITAAFALGLLHCVVLKQPPMVEVVTFLAIFGILATDLGQTVTVDAMRTWSLVVVMMDWRLLMGASHLGSAVLIGVVLAYLFVTLLNRVVPFGLTSQYISKEDSMVYMCDDPPCDKSVGLAAREYVVYVTVFVVDYLATRFFSESLRRERRRMEAAIETAGKVAQALADFDLEGADAANQSDVLPKGLVDAFDAIVCNLRVYKPYLPESCLPGDLEHATSDGRISTEEFPTLDETTSRLSTKSKRSIERVSVVDRNPYRKAHVTLMVVNVKQFLTLSWDDLKLEHSSLVSLIGESVRRYNGVMDGFSGDRICTAFNGSKVCRQHALSAARSAIAVRDKRTTRELSIGIATSSAHCGVLGDDLVRRYSTIGKVGYLVHIVERWARQRDIPILCTEHTYRDIAYHIEGVVEVTRLVVLKAEDQVPIALWQLVEERPHGEEEWMYTMDQMQHTMWSRFNAVVQTLHAEGVQAALLASEQDNPNVERLIASLKKMLWNGSNIGCDLKVVEVGTPAGDAAFHIDAAPSASSSS